MARRKTARRAEMGGIFDWVKRAWRAVAPPVPGLPPPEPPPYALPAPPGAEPSPPRGLVPAEPTRPPSIFDVFAPPAEPAPPRGGPLIFEAFRPALPAEVPPPEERAPVLWETLFAPPAPAEAPPPPVAEFFAPFAPPPEEVPPPAPAPSRMLAPIPGTLVPYGEVEEWQREYPDLAARTGGRMPLWVAFNLGWQIPPTMQIAQAVKESWDLPMLFEQALQASEYPWFQRVAAEAPHTGEPAKLEIQEVARREDPYGDIARFFGIPDVVIEAYARPDEGAEMLWAEVLGPLLDRFTKAMDVLKPWGLRGWFELTPSEDRSWWLTYMESGRPGQVQPG